MRLVVLGGSGYVGRHVVGQAIDDGHEVTVVSRRSRTSDDPKAFRWEAIDPLDSRALVHVVDGADALVHVLGIGGRGTGAPDDTVSRSLRAVLDAYEQVAVRPRLVFVSNDGAGDSARAGGPLRRLTWSILLATVLRRLAPIIDDKSRAEQMLHASESEWSVIRFPSIVDRPDRAIWRVSAGRHSVRTSIAVEDAARFILDRASSPSPRSRTVSVSN